LSRALSVLILLASLRASIRWAKERSGAAEADLVAAGMGGDYTHGPTACKRRLKKICRK
jgi:hypothetical protein